MNEQQEFKRGDIWMANLGEGKGSEQLGVRPVVIIQNNIGNYHAPIVIIASITSSENRISNNLPTHTFMPKEEAPGLDGDSVCMLEQIRTITKGRLFKRIGQVSEKLMTDINEKLLISLALKR